jgi:hypothetical protein
MTEPVGNHQPEDVEGHSTADLVKQLSEQASRLLRQELRLAQLELSQKGKRAGIGAGLFGSGGLLAAYGLAAVFAGLALLLALAVPAWAAALILGGVLLAAAGTLALLGRRLVRGATPALPTQTVGSVKADVAMVRERVRP